MSVETMEETAVITVTAGAAEKLAEIMKDKGIYETHALRVFVSGGGCSGLQYGMTFDPSPREIDTVLTQHGMRVTIDPQSLLYMEGSTIDYFDSEEGGGFHIENPKFVAGQGCGSDGCSGCH